MISVMSLSYGERFCERWYLSRPFTLFVTSLVLLLPPSCLRRLDSFKLARSVTGYNRGADSGSVAFLAQIQVQEASLGWVQNQSHPWGRFRYRRIPWGGIRITGVPHSGSVPSLG